MPKEMTFKLVVDNDRHVCMRMRDHFAPEAIAAIAVLIGATVVFWTYGFFAEERWSPNFGSFTLALSILIECWSWKAATKRQAQALACAVEGRLDKVN
jgi:hypothetical protein